MVNINSVTFSPFPIKLHKYSVYFATVKEKQCSLVCVQWMAEVLQAKDAVEWAYRGEGAVNLVLAYCGSSPNFVCFISLFFLLF